MKQINDGADLQSGPHNTDNNIPMKSQTVSDPVANRLRLKRLIEKLQQKSDLRVDEAEEMMKQFLSGTVPAEDIAACLLALREKGETEQEILGCIFEARRHMVRVALPGVVIDTCGTGGDGTGTFNISTATALVVAGAGVPVAKHGNRSASSRCGSADVLEALGVNIQASPKETCQMVETVGFGFFFAPLYHPAFRHVGPVRKSLGVRTIFNMLGPFLNPAGVKRQIIGVPTQDQARLMAAVARQLSYEHLMIVTSEDGLDEISIGAPTTVYDIRGSQLQTHTIDTQAWGIPRATVADIQGGDAQTNAQLIRKILSGEKGPYRDMVVVNTAAALHVAGSVPTMPDGVALAIDALNTGNAYQVLQHITEGV